MNKNKYKNYKTELDGHVFDSQKEAKRYAELKLLEKAEHISNLEIQKKHPIVFKNIHICNYVADFDYIQDGEKITEDVKSAMTAKLPVYRLKRKLFYVAYGYEITEYQ